MPVLIEVLFFLSLPFLLAAAVFALIALQFRAKNRFVRDAAKAFNTLLLIAVAVIVLMYYALDGYPLAGLPVAIAVGLLFILAPLNALRSVYRYIAAGR